MIGNIKGIIDKVASRKLAVTAAAGAAAGAAAATGAVEEKEKRDGCEGRPAFVVINPENSFRFIGCWKCR